MLGIMMKLLLSSLFFSSIASIQCNSMVFYYYGLKGVNRPYNYGDLNLINRDNYCPFMKQSCCSLEDYINTYDLWNENSAKLKEYLSQIFRIIQQISIVQSSMIPIIPKIQERNYPACKKIESTFFNAPVKFDQVHFYIRSALDAFAYVQKGFYCMICDADNQHFF